MTGRNRILIGSLLLSVPAFSCLVNIEKGDLFSSDAVSGDEGDTPDRDGSDARDVLSEEMLEGFEYSKAITISNPGAELSEYDVLVEVDTASLISAGEMESDCDDMRFLDEDRSTLLIYWLEQGCGTSLTQIWVRVPMIPASSTKTITMLHGNSSADNGSASYSGSFIVMFNTPCPAGWSSFFELNNDHRFPRGSTVYGGTGGAASHDHTYSSDTRRASLTGACSAGVNNSGTPDHTHAIDGTTDTGSNLPPFVDVIFCSSTAPVPLMPASSMTWSVVIPDGWQGDPYFNSNNWFPRGSIIFGEQGGALTHSHPFSGETDQFAGCGLRPFDASYPEVTTDCHHNHTYSGTTSGDSHLPPYEDIAVISPLTTSPFEEGIVMATTSDSPPPLGWDFYPSLNESNRFPRGCTDCGGTGGSTLHQHSYEGDTDPFQSANKCDEDCGDWALVNHSHHFLFETSQADNLPPYLDVVFVKRKTVSVEVTVET